MQAYELSNAWCACTQLLQMYACVWRACTRVSLCVRMRARLRACVCARMCACVCARERVCARSCVCVCMRWRVHGDSTCFLRVVARIQGLIEPI